VELEIYDALGNLVRRFASDESPVRPRDGVYFTSHWLAEASLPSTTAGHHRFVWDLRFERPVALDYDYSIAAIPGRETPPAPEGALVPPGSYEARLTVDGEISRQPVTVVADPRLDWTTADYAALAGFQHETTGLLTDSATLAAAIGGLESRLAALPNGRDGRPLGMVEEGRRRLAAVRAGDDPAAVNGRLAGLAADLESSDSPPTSPQREVLAEARGQIERFAARWREFAQRELPRLEKQLAARALPR
jgi:hypothetical protein